MEAERLDLILTDPPYPAEYLDCLNGLAEFAVYALTAGRFLVTMTGQTFPPDVMTRLAHPSMNYQWSMRINLQRVHASLAAQGDEPRQACALVRQGEYDGERVTDVVTPKHVDEQDTRYHEWGQGEDDVRRLLAAFAALGQSVCDPS